MVAAAGPGRAVRHGEERFHLRARQEVDRAARVAFARHRQHALDARRVLGFAQREVAEEGVNRGEPCVARACRVAAAAFEVVEERSD